MMLLGLGFRHFSMSPTYMYKVKRILRSVDIAECLALVKECMELEKTEDIEKIVFNKFKKKFPEMII
jgi:phosphoenolpyruvate-protein kinase (PTS system EI component)